MNDGMLWMSDRGNRPVEKKIAEALSYYRQKFGVEPTLCLAHPSEIPTDMQQVEGVTVRTDRIVLPMHFWIGVEREPSKSAGKSMLAVGMTAR